MGITNESFALYSKLHSEGHTNFKEPLSVLELGAQAVHISGFDFVKSTLKLMGHDEQVATNYRQNMLMRNVHESIGHSYDSFDLDTLDPKTVLMDLNEDNNIKSSRFWQAYDLVTNHGTTEHLFNQASAFKLMHDVCKVGGVMVHVLPCIEPNHGLYCYSPVLFEALANHNQYDSLLLTVTDQPNNNTAPPFYRGYSEADLKKTCYVYVALKKKIDADFVMPSQIFRGGNK